MEDLLRRTSAMRFGKDLRLLEVQNPLIRVLAWTESVLDTVLDTAPQTPAKQLGRGNPSPGRALISTRSIHTVNSQIASAIERWLIKIPQCRFGLIDWTLSLQVRKLLGSSAAVTVRVGSGAEAGDPEIVMVQQGRLLAVAVRTMALSYGRGALTLGAMRALVPG